MTRPTLGLIFVLTGPQSLTAQTHDWIAVSRSSVVAIEVDSTTASKRGDKWEVWFRLHYTRPGEIEVGKAIKHYMEAKDRFLVDCASRKYASIAAYYYSAAGEVVESSEHDLATAIMQSLVPETVGESMVDGLCRIVPRLDGTRELQFATWRSAWFRADSLIPSACATETDTDINNACRVY